MTTPATPTPLLASAGTRCTPASARLGPRLEARDEACRRHQHLHVPSADALMSASRMRGWDEPSKKGGLARL